MLASLRSDTWPSCHGTGGRLHTGIGGRLARNRHVLRGHRFHPDGAVLRAGRRTGCDRRFLRPCDSQATHRQRSERRRTVCNRLLSMSSAPPLGAAQAYVGKGFPTCGAFCYIANAVQANLLAARASIGRPPTRSTTWRRATKRASTSTSSTCGAASPRATRTPKATRRYCVVRA
jgi:hypothetical protein